MEYKEDCKDISKNETETIENDINLNQIMICPKCKAINRNERYCHSCGLDLLCGEKETTNVSIEQTNEVYETFIIIIEYATIIAYFLALIIGLYIIVKVNFFIGLIVGVAIAIISWFNKILFQTFGEIIKILQDIKNKL